MDRRIYMLAISAFVVGTVELIIGGILHLVAADLQVSVSAAGQLISVFSLIFAIAAPVLLAVTAKWERKRLYIGALFVFLIGNVLAVFSPNYEMLLAARALEAASGALVIALSLSMGSALVAPEYKGRALGIIFMGISGSLVLGVPLGMVIGEAYGWRAPFVAISILTLLVLLSMTILLPKTEAAGEHVPLRQQFSALKHSKIASAQLVSFLMLTGHLTLYAYFTPFLQSVIHMEQGMLSVVYFIFGMAAVMGGGLGGWISDRWGAGRSILTMIPLFALSMLVLPLTTHVSLYVFLAVVIVWSALSWAFSPAQQTYLITNAPDTSDIQLGLNLSATHLGIAFGSIIGGVVLEKSSVVYNAWTGVAFVLLAFGFAWYSITRSPARQTEAAPASQQAY